jgi:hypothetical protein
MAVLAFLVLFEPSVTLQICNIGPHQKSALSHVLKRAPFYINSLWFETIKTSEMTCLWNKGAVVFLTIYVLVVITDTSALWLSTLELL